MNPDQTQPAFFYLLGLITGRGHILRDSKSVIIEFSHANEFVECIAHCPICGWLATKPKGVDGDTLKCKNPECNHDVDKGVKSRYNQPVETITSVKDIIIPFLRTEIDATYSITGNKSMTLLVIDLKNNDTIFSAIADSFNGDSSYDRFHIPEVAYACTREEKIEFVNGLLDTAGFASQGRRRCRFMSLNESWAYGRRTQDLSRQYRQDKAGASTFARTTGNHLGSMWVLARNREDVL